MQRFFVASCLTLLAVILRSSDTNALHVIGGSVKVVQGGTAILPCYVTDTNDDLTQISWQRRTRENPRNYIFFTASYSDGDRPQFFNEQFKFIGNFKDKNGTLQLLNVTLKDEGSYTCIFTLVPSGNQKTEMPLKVFVPPFTSVKDNLPTLGTEEVLFATCTAVGSRPPAEVRWLTGALADRVRTTRNYIHYDNGMTTTVSSLFGVPTGDINGHKVQCVISGDSLSKEETLPFTIQIYFSPREVNIKAISGDSFECVTEANPNANFTWSRSGQSLLQSAVRVEGAKLQLLNLTSDLNGLYQCEASNKYGRKHGQLYVHVPSAFNMSKRLTREERIEIVLISGERSNRVIAADFNARHPTRPPISHATVSKLLAKFRETGSVLDLPKCGRKKTVTNEETSVAVLASFSKSPQRSTRRMSLKSGISRTSLQRILATHKWHPYKLQLLQHLNEDDPDRRTEFAEWAKQKLEQDPQFTQKILFSDEANFYVNGEVGVVYGVQR
uniref:Ig-like domain-containing protein n=1 Tax=Oreochromis aureus TaxID=47969 RepID=A0AAZ1XEX3_OREAU